MPQAVETEVKGERRLPRRPVGRETVQERVYRQIREMILNGEIEPGQTITLQSLSDAFQVSAMPVREALRRLMAEQALTVVFGRSVGVPALTRDRLRDLCRVRCEVEPLATVWATSRIMPAGLVRLAELLDRMQEAAAQKNGRLFVPANYEFHFLIYRAAASPALLSIIESLWLQIVRYFHALRNSGNWREANVAHQALLSGLMRQNAKEAASALRRDIADAAATLMGLLR